ncbi:MAG: PilZ domain-containing protein [Elusimicrobia bacterium]|nr:PilZ domain-containing protein [Elusimicrobiota bacterium]
MASETYTGPDRRSAPRIKYEGPAQLAGKSTDSLMHSERCFFVNLSEGGCCLKSPVSFNDGSELSITFKLPGLLNIFICSTVKVIWCALYPVERCYLIGLAFGQLNPYDLTALRSFIMIEVRNQSEIV